MDIKAAVVPVTPFAQNCSIVWCTETNQAAVVDPGGDIARIKEALDEVGVTPAKILVTHGHIDHAGGVGALAADLGLPIEGPHRDDGFLIDDLVNSGAQFGFTGVTTFTPDRWLEDGDTVTLGNTEFQVRHCPGHTPGHVVFFHEGAGVAIVGDVLFQGSIGRTDFPRGDHATLIRSITERLWPLGDEVAFIPGHGPMSTFGDERKANPYVSDMALAHGF